MNIEKKNKVYRFKTLKKKKEVIKSQS